jgi:hypothetical protein
MFARVSCVARYLAKANAHLLFGSDTPSNFIYTNPPGLNGRLEMSNDTIDRELIYQRAMRSIQIDGPG